MSLQEKKPYYKYFKWLDQAEKNEEEDILNEMKRKMDEMLSYEVEEGRVNEMNKKMENELARVHNEIRWLKLGFGVLKVVIVVLILS